MPIHDFVIVLDNPIHEFLPGSLINGRVILQKTGNVTTSGITITIFGRAETHWVVHHHEEGPTYYYGNRGLFKDFRQLFGYGHVEEQIPFDNIEFPFSFQLPNGHLLHSFEAHSMKVLYGLEARVNRSFWSSDMTAFQPIVVLPTPVDLNFVPGAGLPSSGEVVHSFGILNTSQPLHISMECPRTGVCPGETVFVNSQIANFSDRIITLLVAKLVQIWHMRGSHECGHCIGDGKDSWRNHFVVMNETGRGGGLGPGGMISWSFQLSVPPHAQSSIPIEICEIISLKYVVQIHAHYTGCCRDKMVVAEMPLIVGNIPVSLNGQPLSEHSTLFEGAPSWQFV